MNKVLIMFLVVLFSMFACVTHVDQDELQSIQTVNGFVASINLNANPVIIKTDADSLFLLHDYKYNWLSARAYREISMIRIDGKWTAIN